jgi:hypothetical protein
MARPSDYNQEIAAAICAEIVDGMSLRSICRKDDMPAISTVMLWLSRHAEFSEQYAHARDAQADTLADELLEICDDATNDWMDKELRNSKGEVTGSITVVDQEHINRSRLRVETRKWIASKLKPKKYGDRLTVDSTVKHSADAYSDDELAHIASTGSDGAIEASGGQKEPSELH